MHSGRLASFLLACCLPLCACGTARPGPAAVPEGWTPLTDAVAGFSLAYPPDAVTLGVDGTATVLRHAVPFVHADPCDFHGMVTDLAELTDFHVSFDVLEKTLRAAILETEGTDYVVSAYMRGDGLRASPDGTVGPASFAGLRGWRVDSGVEGCGRTAYYFPTPTGRTLVVLRAWVPELRGAAASEALGVPGVLAPDAEDALFTRILDTVRFLGDEPAGPASGSGASE